MSNSQDYWATPPGIDKRIDDLCEQFVYATYNGAVQMYGDKNGAYGVEVIEDNQPTKTCVKCAPYVGRIYRFGQFTPEFPKHPHCKHFYRLVMQKPNS